jgi:hypothetical protein
MHRRTLLAGLVAMTVAPAPAMAAEGTRALGCQPQSEGSFNNVYADSRSVVAGPLALVGLRGIATASRDHVDRNGFKSPLVLRPGRKATLSIDPASRAQVRLTYGGGDRHDLASLPHTIRFTACSRPRSRSRIGRRTRVTFWPGTFALAPGVTCMRFSVTTGGERRRFALPVAGGACG